LNDLISILNKQKFFLIFLFLISFLIRFLFFEYFLKNGTLIGSQDSQEYHDIAVQLLKGHGFSFSTDLIKADGRVYKLFADLKKNYVADFFRLPGYPLFLAFCYKMFGLDPKYALRLQVFLSSFIPILIFILSIVLFPANLLVAKVAAIFSSFYLGFVLYSGVLFTESIFLIFLILFFILFFKNNSFFFCNKTVHSKKQLFLAGIFLGIASLIRPVGLYVVLLSILLLLFSSFIIWEKLKAVLIIFLGWFLIVFWWLLRNFILTGYIFFHTLPGPHFLNYITSHMCMRFYNCDWPTASEKLMQEWADAVKDREKTVGKKLSEIECCIVAESLAKKYWLKDPVMFLKFSFYNMYRTLSDLHSYEFFIELKDFSALWVRFLLSLKYLYFLVLFGSLGFVILSFFRVENFCCLCKVLPFIVLFVFITLATGFSRVRLPIEPFLIILSMSFWLDICGRKKRDL
jgi:hypothetical protein